MESESTLPLISIGVPTYNGAARIMKSLNSIFGQNYPNLELIISDNCSTDDTQQLCLEVIRTHPGTQIRYFRQKQNVGILKNFEFTLRQATGTYFMWVADDDELEQGVLFRYAAFFEQHPQYVNISGKINYWRDGRLLFDEQFTIEHDSALRRVLSFYGGVRWTGMIHGIMRLEHVQHVPLHQVFGADYHFIANVAHIGKIKSFDFPGYHKSLEGSSRDWIKFARALGEPGWVGKFPRIKIAYDALLEPYRSPVYDGLSHFSRLSLGLLSVTAILYNYYIKLKMEALRKKSRSLLQRDQT